MPITFEDMLDDKSGKHVYFVAPNRSDVMDVSIGRLSYELTRKNDQKFKREAHRLIITKHLTTSRKLTAISALFLMSSANSVLVSVTLFGAAILSSIFGFPGCDHLLSQRITGKSFFQISRAISRNFASIDFRDSTKKSAQLDLISILLPKSSSEDPKYVCK